uniref:Putative secreted peptide n=1 Tax=Anopheles braziliensis TaxID=58242 RepID=A0A2M3ZS86_9DIPT
MSNSWIFTVFMLLRCSGGTFDTTSSTPTSLVDWEIKIISLPEFPFPVGKTEKNLTRERKAENTVLGSVRGRPRERCKCSIKCNGIATCRCSSTIYRHGLI